MNLNLVRTFVAVAEARSFSAAARTLELPTSSVSRAVARLEADLGTTLFERTSRKTSLSAAGRLYLEHASTALASLAEGELRVAELVGTPRGEVRLSVPMNFDQGFLAARLVAFVRAYPQVRLRVEPTNRWVDLAHERFDVALRAMQRPDEADVVLREVGRFQAWLGASTAYVRAHGLPRRPQDLARHACVNLGDYVFGLRLLGPDGVETVEVGGPIVANDIPLARQLVEQGAGIGPVVFAPGDRPALPRGLVRVLPRHVAEGPRLYVASTSRKTQPLRVRLLRDFLVEAYLAQGEAVTRAPR